VDRPDHIMDVAESDGVYRPTCTCGFSFYVASPMKDFAIEQLRKHADRVFKRPYPRSVTLHLRVEAGEQSPEQIRELVEIAKREALKV